MKFRKIPKKSVLLLCIQWSESRSHTSLRPINFRNNVCLWYAKVGWLYHLYRSNVIGPKSLIRFVICIHKNWFNLFAINLINCDRFIAYFVSILFYCSKKHIKNTLVLTKCSMARNCILVGKFLKESPPPKKSGNK